MRDRVTCRYERVCAVADALLADPADPRSLEAHARGEGVSRRTLTRLFAHDTGMSFDRRRTQVRLRAALTLLADGQPVSRVAPTEPALAQGISPMIHSALDFPEVTDAQLRTAWTAGPATS
ncbi:helix-turn-helix domain-containing protein [Nonomuraea jabiensis]|uniref:helix-turn-helix domain-containing protein n=1 Tax=Nonomuraea jabiensis TaxID=882448 RepID=UPI003D7299A3